MGVRAVLVALAAILAGAQVAPAANKEKLRYGLRLPQLNLVTGFALSADGVIIAAEAEADDGEETTDVLAEAVAIEKTMTGNSQDAERYGKLSKLYARAKEPVKARRARDRAIALYRQRLEAEPDNGQAMVSLGESLWAADQIDESEKVLRHAVRTAPREWRGWISLGQVLGDRAVEALAGKDAAAAHRKDLERLLLAAGPPQGTSPQQREQALKLLTEARACFDRAVTLAPQERRPYLARAAGCWRHALIRPSLRPEQGQLPLDVDRIMEATAEALPDLKKASQLGPKDYRTLGALAFFEMMIAFADRKEMATKTEFPPLPESTRQSLRKTFEELAKLAQGPDQRTAAGAEKVSGLLLWMGLKDGRAAEAHLRRSVALNPLREDAWDLLCAVVGNPYVGDLWQTVVEGAWDLLCVVLNGPEATPDDLVALCKERLKHKDSARGHLYLAQAYGAFETQDREAEVRAALKLEPDNYHANLSLAVLLLLHPDDDAAALAEASQVLAHLGPVLQKGMTKEQWCDCTITWAVCEGLKGNVAGAKQAVKYVLDSDPKNRRARLVLEALEE